MSDYERDPHHLEDYDPPDRCPHCHDIIDERDTPVEAGDGEHVHAGCLADYNDEHRDEPPMSLYVFKTYCIACNLSIGEEEKSLAVPEGFIHQGCFTIYEEALDLIDATTPKDAA